MKKALNVIGDILVVVVLIFAVMVTVMVIASTTNDNRIPSLFGYALLNVESDSMESENGFFTGDLIVIRLLSEEESNNLKVGDVITFNRYFQNKQFIETHRIVEMTDSMVDSSQSRSTRVIKHEVVDGVWKHGSTTYYATAGDNTVATDITEDGALDLTYPGAIIGKWEGIRVPHIGSAIKFLQSQMGFMLCIVVPLSLFFFYQLYAFIVAMNNRKKEKAIEEINATADDIKQKAIAEFLAQQQATAGTQATPTEAPKENEQAQPPKAEEAPADDAEKEKVIAEYLAKQEAEKAAEEEAKKQKIIEEYLANKKDNSDK